MVKIIRNCTISRHPRPRYTEYKPIYLHINNKKEGLEKVFYIDIDIETEAYYDLYNYVYNIKNGYHKSYDYKRKLVDIYYFTDDKHQGKYKNYSINGQLLMSKDYINNKLNGSFIQYYNNGQISLIRDFIDNNINGYDIGYDEDGYIKFIHYMINNQIIKDKYIYKFIYNLLHRLYLV
jgi:antitoxin component YwqK of YwqJK toxin-antitoxin module